MRVRWAAWMTDSFEADEGIEIPICPASQYMKSEAPSSKQTQMVK